MMTSLVEKSSIMSCGGPHKSKRKVRADTRPRDSKEANASDGFSDKRVMPSYGLHGVCQLCGDCKSDLDSQKQRFGRFSQGEEDSNGAKEEEEILDYIDWWDSARSELHSLVMCNLDAAFKIAINRIAACGYSEEVATKAVMSPGICYGPKDTLSNIVDNTLKFLKTCKPPDLKGPKSCMDLKELEDYLQAQFIYVLRVIRPFSSSGDMLWYLLVSDLNVSDACAVVFGRYDISDDMNSNVSSHCLPKNQLDDAYRRLDMDLDPPLLRHMTSPATDFQRVISSWVPNMTESKKKLNLNKKSCGEAGAQSSMNVVDWSFVVSKTSQRLEGKGKFSSSRKVQISGTRKRESSFEQKLHHVDTGRQAHGHNKSGFKQGKFFGLTINNKTRSPGEFFPKNASMNRAVEVKISEDKTKHNCTTIKGNVNPTSSVCSRCAAAASSLLTANRHPKSTVSPATCIDSPQMKRVPSQVSRVGPAGVTSCYHKVTEIKDAKGQSIKPDEKTEMIFRLISRIYKLKDQLEQWTEWANSRVMQATLRLTKHKDELNVLRQEKKDPERLKQSIKESTSRKLSEIENALSKANEQVERADGAFIKLEAKNSALKRKTEAVKLEAVESAANCHEISERDRKAISSIKSLDKQKSSLQEELILLKQKHAHSQNEFIQARGVLAQLEAKRELELEVTKDLQLKASSMKMKMEQGEALRKFKEDAFRSKAEINLQKYKDDIQMLERQVVKLSLSSYAIKTASPAKGISGGWASRVIDCAQKAPMFPDALFSHLRKETQKSHKISAKDVKRDRECVMCLSEEISVVFLPCAHQAICAKCNKLLEKNGMKDCPSCRSVIQHRIVVRYEVPWFGNSLGMGKWVLKLLVATS